jgi:large subunit ribosomal protein L17
MRHRVKTVKLGRTSQHRDLMLANMVGSLIQHNRIKTTLAKAKALRPIAEKLVTLGKKGGLHSRRLALSKLINNENWVKKLFGDIAPRFKERNGGYTRILKLGARHSDASQMALIEWVDNVVEAAPVAESEAKAEEGKKKTTPKKKKEATAE